MPKDMLLSVCVRASLVKDQLRKQCIKGLGVLVASSPVVAFADGDIAAMIESTATGADSGTKSMLKIAQFIGVLFVIGALVAAKTKKDNPQIKTSHIIGGGAIGVILLVVPELIKRGQTQMGLTPVSVG
ncbi:DUF6750 family protein [Pseudomonas mosselii]|uniref:Conjugal transfer protein TraR n=1 Tax=Pseudomonas mosselii TaxID=78327 RepID=A0A7W2Q0W3_9PSED|nr:DUF6750 family protein [Pseudomonas mosselii]MBA6068062.1 conjugal transfer protein TraR [Pseudomonas mosselii]